MGQDGSTEAIAGALVAASRARKQSVECGRPRDLLLDGNRAPTT